MKLDWGLSVPRVVSRAQHDGEEVSAWRVYEEKEMEGESAKDSN